jgi:transposase-like protein
MTRKCPECNSKEIVTRWNSYNEARFECQKCNAVRDECDVK